MVTPNEIALAIAAIKLANHAVKKYGQKPTKKKRSKHTAVTTANKNGRLNNG